MPKNTTSSTLPEVILGDEVDLTQFFGDEDIWGDFDPTRTGGRTFEPVPEGEYDAEVVQVEGPMLNKAGKAYMLKFQYRIIDDNPQYNNHRVFQYISLQPQSKFNLVNTFAALGKVPGDTTYVRGEFDGMPCRLKITVDPGNETYGPSNKVRFVNPAGSGDETSTTTRLW